MKYFIITLFSLSIVLIAVVTLLKINPIKAGSISAYYNNNGSFAGFVQEKSGLIRACEFSTNGSILSCSKWFDEKSLKQGQNEGLNLEDI